jgi:hypothetical protein
MTPLENMITVLNQNGAVIAYLAWPEGCFNQTDDAMEAHAKCVARHYLGTLPEERIKVVFPNGNSRLIDI